jgi:pyridinium-3,5-biscarboxylic acid mononucleotide synthase
MSPELFRELLERVSRGELGVEDALERARHLPFRDLGEAVVDHHRALRLGVPEVIYGAGKTIEQLIAICDELVAAGSNLLVTRLDDENAAVLAARFPGARHAPRARLVRYEPRPPRERPAAPVAVIAAGTSDLPVAEEALETLGAVGLRAMAVHDVGVAGIHRLLARYDELRSASAAIVVAGMEGALPSVVGGMVAYPIIAVPTSVGYGTALGGLTALMAMLTSCASGLTVVNIDNGFGAAMAVHRILPRAQEP